MAKLTIYIDGASRNNPGQAGIGVVIKQGHKTIKEIAKYLGETTNNIAEYTALVRGLEEVLKLKADEAEFFSDSELLVKQINGEYRVKHDGLIPLYVRAKEMIQKLTSFKIAHVPREKNKEADKLANKAIDERSLGSF